MYKSMITFFNCDLKLIIKLQLNHLEDYRILSNLFQNS